MTKKGTGEGSVFFNKQRNKWNAQYKEYNINTGKFTPKTKSFLTEDEAKKYLSTIMYQKENPLYIKHHGIPMYAILKSNLDFKLKSNLVSPAQYGRVLDSIKQLEKTPFGNKNIDTISYDEIQAYLNSLTHLSNSVIAKAHQQLNQAFKTALEKGYLMKNPMLNVFRPRSDNDDKEVRALTVEEQQAFTTWILNHSLNECNYKNIFLIQMYMGLRIGEASALSIYDVDLKNKRLNVHRTLSTDKNKNIIMGNKTKTYSGKRILPIPDFLLPYFIEQINIANTQENNEEKLLFKPKNSKYVRRTTINNLLKRILQKEFNITGISSHSLRHTFGTRCIESGMAPVVVQKLMDHKNISVTLNTYTSVFDKFKQREFDKVNQYYLDENLIGNKKSLNSQISLDKLEEK